MALLIESEFKEVFTAPMKRIVDKQPPVEFWPYFDGIPKGDFGGYDCSEGQVSNVWNDADDNFQHILIDSNTPNVFMVIVLDLVKKSVCGHRLLNLEREYDVV